MRDPEYARKQIAHYRLEKARAVETLRQIDSRRISFLQASGDDRPRDVTSHRRGEIEREMRLYDELVELWSRDLPGGRRRGLLAAAEHAQAPDGSGDQKRAGQDGGVEDRITQHDVDYGELLDRSVKRSG
jgi:hypothetical protein